MVERLERLVLDNPVLLFVVGLVVAGGAFLDKTAEVLGKNVTTPAKIVGGAIALLSAAWGIAKVTVVRRHRVKRLLMRDPPPLVGDVRPWEVGVAESAIAEQLAGSDEPEYVPRDVDAELEQLLGDESRFVVVRGRSKAGKSRTAFEAVQRVAPDWRLVALNPGQLVADAVELGVLPGEPTILWLDKLDGFLGNGGLGPGLRDEIVNREPPVVIVGTIENVAWNAILGSEADDASGLYEAAETLRAASDIQLGRATSEELKRASAAYHVKFEEGIAEFFVAVPETRRKYDGARKRTFTAVIRAVVDWQRTGISKGISRTDLKRLMLKYLEGADPGAWFERSLEWANEEVAPGIRLVTAEGSSERSMRYRVADHLVAYVTESERAPVQLAAWKAAVSAASPRDALAIASRASQANQPVVAEKALRKAHGAATASERTRVQAAARLGLMLASRGDVRAAERSYREAIAGGSSAAKNNYGFMLMRTGKLDKAEEILAEAVGEGNRTAAFNLLATLSKARRLGAGPARFQPGVEAGNPAAALMLGNVQHAAGDLGAADESYQRAEVGTRQRDAEIAQRAGMLRALLAYERGDAGGARALLDGAWGERQWEETLKRLRQVGLERLDELMGQLRADSPV